MGRREDGGWEIGREKIMVLVGVNSVGSVIQARHNCMHIRPGTFPGTCVKKKSNYKYTQYDQTEFKNKKSEC